ncbi:MAG TPA: FtsX-like permease family protein [Arachidicoccus sp.]|nr:FtsX-like permease family protein [Arachidicoccus sp.]
MKSAWRNLTRNKVQSIINVIGLSIGLTCSILIFMWVQNELSIDRFHVKGDRLYKVYAREYYKGHVDGNYDTPSPLGLELKSKIPEIEDAVTMEEENESTSLKVGNKILKAEGSGASSGFFNVFSYPLLLGSADNALATLSSIAISKRLAIVLFGSAEGAMNKIIRYDNKKDCQVTAIFDDMSKLSSRKLDYLISWKAFQKENPWAKNWQTSGPLTYVLLKQGTSASAVDKKITHFRNLYTDDSSNAYHVELGLQKYDEVYLHNHFENGKVAGGRIEYVHLFIIIAIFILFIACINFMNLATARSANRAKEVGVRKVIGAKRSAIIRQFITESLLLTICAVIVAIPLVTILLPFFNHITQKQIAYPFQESSFWLGILSITVITTLISSSYPAFYLSSFNPVKVLKGTTKVSVNTVWFRKGLVVLQFVLSMILITGTIIVSRQINFIQNKSLGYNKEQLLYIPIEGDLADKYQIFKEKVLQTSGIKYVSSISDNPVSLNQLNNSVDWEGRPPNTMIAFEHPGVNYDFVKTMGLQMAAGRDFSKNYPSDKDGFLLNETAIKEIGYKNPIGKYVTINGWKGQIIGVIKDFNFSSLHEPIKPMIINLYDKMTNGNILLRTEPGKTKEALASIEKVCRELNPAFPFTYMFADQQYRELYNNEQVISKLTNAFALLAIFISCLGLFGLVMFAAEQRTKEIGIRKVLGASIRNIIQLMSSDFLKIVLLAVVIACPAAWWGMHLWLDNYAYKIDITWRPFVAAGALITLIAICTISFQSIKVAIANPVKSLKTE